MNGQLEQIRLRINETDKELSCLFSQRMDLVAQVAKIKEKAGLLRFHSLNRGGNQR